MKYYKLQIASLDEAYLNELTDTRGVDRTDIDFDRDGEGLITNAIIRAVFIEIVLKNIEDEDDSRKLIDSIYTNCLDSGFNIDEDELETQQAKDFINNF